MGLKVHFYSEAADSELKYAVIASRHAGKWVFCRHKDRNTWELPGGTRENGESIDETARRELYEETGARTFQIDPVTIYGVECDGIVTKGKLYYSEIEALGDLPPLEIEEICLGCSPPGAWTYAQIQPYLWEKVCEFLKEKEAYAD